MTSVPANSDGRVFFQQLSINNTGAYGQLDPNLVLPKLTLPQNGIAAVDMPNFWLGHTDTAAPTENSNFHSAPGHSAARRSNWPAASRAGGDQHASLRRG